MERTLSASRQARGDSAGVQSAAPSEDMPESRPAAIFTDTQASEEIPREDDSAMSMEEEAPSTSSSYEEDSGQHFQRAL